MDASFHSAHLALFGHDRLYELVQDPLWYMKFDKFEQTRIVGAAAAGTLIKNRSVSAAAKASRERLYEMMADLLEHDQVALGGPGQGLYEFDSEREDIDTGVFHHSNRANGTSLERLNAMELIRLAVPVWRNPSPADAPRLKGKPIYMGHEWKGHQSFFPYHWIIRQDGTSERLLKDSQIGWHAGKWSVNKRSVAICFDDDLTHKAPNAAMLAEGRRILHEEYGWLHPNDENIHGHFDFFDTECPGDQFTSGANWKAQLLS